MKKYTLTFILALFTFTGSLIFANNPLIEALDSQDNDREVFIQIINTINEQEVEKVIKEAIRYAITTKKSEEFVKILLHLLRTRISEENYRSFISECLVISASVQDLNILRQLYLSFGAVVGSNPLHYLVINLDSSLLDNYLRTYEGIWGFNLDTNVYNTKGQTPLSIAMQMFFNESQSIQTREELIRIIDFLLEFGANIEAQDVNNISPLYYLERQVESRNREQLSTQEINLIAVIHNRRRDLIQSSILATYLVSSLTLRRDFSPLFVHVSKSRRPSSRSSNCCVSLEQWQGKSSGDR